MFVSINPAMQARIGKQADGLLPLLPLSQRTRFRQTLDDMIRDGGLEAVRLIAMKQALNEVIQPPPESDCEEPDCEEAEEQTPRTDSETELVRLRTVRLIMLLSHIRLEEQQEQSMNPVRRSTRT